MMPAGPASLHHTGSLPASLPSHSGSQLQAQVVPYSPAEGEKAPCASWGPAPGHREVAYAPRDSHTMEVTPP